MKFIDKSNCISTSGDSHEFSVSPLLQRDWHGEIQQISAFSRPKPDVMNNLSFMEVNQSVRSTASHELYLGEEGFNIPWSELDIKNRIGRGMSSELHALVIIDATKLLLVLQI